MASLIPWDATRWQRLFFPIWGGQALSLVGSRLVQFALVWWLTKTTGSATVLAVASMMAYLPQVIISPFAGALVDRWNRRRVLILADGSIALATVLLAVLFATGWIEPWHVFALMFVRAVGGAFHWPAMSASTSLMVPEKHLPRIAGMNQTLFGVAMIASPPLGALVLEVLPIQGVLSIDVITAALAILPLLFILIPQPKRAEAGAGVRQTVIGGLVEGLRFAWSWPGMLLLIGALALMNFVVNPAFALLPLYVVRVLDGAAIELGSLQGVMGIGAILGGLILGAWGGFKRRILTALLAVAVMGVAIVAMGIAPHGWVLLVGGALFICGLMESVAVGAFTATLQTSVPNRMQGRVFSLVGSATQLVVPVGLALAGPLTDRFGIQVWFVIGGIAYLIVGLGPLFVRPIMAIEARGEELKQADEEALGEAAAEATP
ncbi:MFS transporter [Candidatus Bipolaricaulota bacterium]|nr:MFS transporter [Candidatus Bipolaricaulota bacterium]